MKFQPALRRSKRGPKPPPARNPEAFALRQPYHKRRKKFTKEPLRETSEAGEEQSGEVEQEGDFLLFDEHYLRWHLEVLNNTCDPIIENDRLTRAGDIATQHLGHLLDRPLADVHEEALRALREILHIAKFNNRLEEPHAPPPVPAIMDTPLLGQFLVAINGFIKARNATQLADYLAIEPPFGDHYVRMIEELRQNFPRGSEDALEEKCSQNLSAARDGADGSTWTPFIKFMAQYLGYLRDVDADPNKYLETYELLSEVQLRANFAFSHATLGYMMLSVVVTNARLVCRLAIGLDKQPELIAHLRAKQPGGEDSGPGDTLPEKAANLIRQPLTTCLNDRTSGLKDGRPDGKKRGIYTLANLCLKILFQCRKTRNATQIFENINNASPPLSAYSKRERVTYLYYLGRFLFQNSHFYRAHLALEAAYAESPTHPTCVRQRRHILIHLLATNIILGLFPTPQILARPEAANLTAYFNPLCAAIASGNLALLHAHLEPTSAFAPFFTHFRLLLQLRNRTLPLAWRSLVRKTYIIAGTAPSDPTSKVAPTIALTDLVTLFLHLSPDASSDPLAAYIDPDFAGLGFPADDPGLFVNLTAVESKLSALVDQGLLSGFISHKLMKFAILGAGKKGGALRAGFPVPWEVLRERAEREGGSEVPGWKGDGGVGGGVGGVGPGMVVNLSGVRGIGAG